MKKRIISLLLISVLSTSLTACGKTATNNDSSTDNNTNTTTQDETNEDSEKTKQNSSVVADPSVTVEKVVTVADFKNKNSSDITTLLGEPSDKSDNVYTYQKDGYKFIVTYYDDICGKIKIIPDKELKYPEDATVILNVLGINAGDSDTISPKEMSWNSKFDTYNITVNPKENDVSKLDSLNIILDEKYK